MATETTTTQTTQPTLAEFEKRIIAQIQDAEARIVKFEEKAKEYRLKAELSAIDGLKVARETLEQKLQALSTTSQANLVRAKTDVDTAAASLKTSLDQFGSKLSAMTAKK
jgi:uncharacterized coiled-coil DUF342 family protein